MGVGVQGKASGEVAQHAGHGLDVHTVLQGDGCEGVTEVMEPDFWDPGSSQYSLKHIVDAVRRDGATIGGRENVLVIGFRLLLF